MQSRLPLLFILMTVTIDSMGIGLIMPVMPNLITEVNGGTLANVHFLAIPFNASAPEAAKLLANFMLSPEAQVKKADTAIWGDPTVLSMPSQDAEPSLDVVRQGCDRGRHRLMWRCHAEA